MLWDVIYEFYVKYVFGGSYGGVYYYASIGDLRNATSGQNFELHSSDINVFQFTGMSGTTWYVNLGNYLSLIATIISLVVIVVLACLFIKKIYNMVAHVIA